jgi:hypothetical protein
MPNFAAALNRKAEDVKRPPTLPQGHYMMAIASYEATDEPIVSAKGRWDKLGFKVQVLAPLDDVAPEDLAEFGGDVSKVTLSNGNAISFMFDLDDDHKFAQTEYKLKEFLTSLGIDENLELKERLPMAKGAQFVGEVVWVKDRNDPNIWHANVDKARAVA